MRRGVASSQEGRLADMAASDLELGYACVKAYAATGDGAAFVVALFAVDRPELVAVIEADNLGRLAPALRARWLRSISRARARPRSE